MLVKVTPNQLGSHPKISNSSKLQKTGSNSEEFLLSVFMEMHADLSANWFQLDGTLIFICVHATKMTETTRSLVSCPPHHSHFPKHHILNKMVISTNDCTVSTQASLKEERYNVGGRLWQVGRNACLSYMTNSCAGICNQSTAQPGKQVAE